MSEDTAAEEAQPESQLGGVIHREYWGWRSKDHDMCVTFCRTPGQRRRGARCPSCYGRVAIRALDGEEIEPAGTRWAWLVGSFLGGWAAAWRDATAGMARGPASVCARCEAAEDRGEA